MAKKELSLILRAKNDLQVGLAKARSTLESFGSSALNVGKMLGGAFVAAGSAVVAFATKALTSWAEAEAGTNALRASFRAFGEEVAVNTERITQLTAAMQDETGLSGDALTARAARLKMLGVETAAMGEALKATVALASVGMDEESATRAVAQALQGNFTALQKYIPALRSATTEEEKAAIVRDFVARGYQQQKDQLNTLAGQWSLLKERVGDAWEEIGAAIAGNDTIKSALETMGEYAKRFGESVKEWTANGGIEDARAGFQYLWETIRYGAQQSWGWMKLLWALISDAGPINYMSGVFGAAANAIVENIKWSIEWVKALWAKFQNPFSEFKTPDSSGYKAAMKTVLDEIRGKNMAERDDRARLLDELTAMEEAHNARLTSIAESHVAGLEKVNQQRVESERTAGQARVDINAKTAEQVWTTAAQLKSSLEEVNTSRAENEQATLDEIVSSNSEAASAVKDEWVAAHQEIASSKIESVKLGPTGQTLTTQGPAVTSGTPQNPYGFNQNDRTGIRVQWEILKVMSDIRNTNRNLLTWG